MKRIAAKNYLGQTIENVRLSRGSSAKMEDVTWLNEFAALSDRDKEKRVFDILCFKGFGRMNNWPSFEMMEPPTRTNGPLTMNSSMYGHKTKLEREFKQGLGQA